MDRYSQENIIAFIMFIVLISVGGILFSQKETYLKTYCNSAGNNCNLEGVRPFEGIGFECSKAKNSCILKEVQSGAVLKEFKLNEIEKAKAMDENYVKGTLSKLSEYERGIIDKYARIVLPKEPIKTENSRRAYSLYLFAKENNKERMYVIFVNQNLNFVARNERNINSYLGSSQENLRIRDVQTVPPPRLFSVIFILVGIIGLLRILGVIHIERKINQTDFVAILIPLLLSAGFYHFAYPTFEMPVKAVILFFCGLMCFVSFSALFGNIRTIRELSPEQRAEYEIMQRTADYMRQKTADYARRRRK